MACEVLQINSILLQHCGHSVSSKREKKKEIKENKALQSNTYFLFTNFKRTHFANKCFANEKISFKSDRKWNAYKKQMQT